MCFKHTTCMGINVTMHFAEVAIGLLTGGAAILIIAGLVLEALHDGGRHLHLFPDSHDQPQMPVAGVHVKNEASNDAGPTRYSCGDTARHDDEDRSGSEENCEPVRQRRKKRRRKEKGNTPRPDRAPRSTSAEIEGV